MNIKDGELRDVQCRSEAIISEGTKVISEVFAVETIGRVHLKQTKETYLPVTCYKTSCKYLCFSCIDSQTINYTK